MELNVKERLMLMNILPKEDNFITLKIVRKLMNDLSFSEEEVKEFKFETKTEGNKTFTVWDGEKNNIVKEIEIGEKAMDIIVNAFKKLDQEKKLTFEHYDIYEKFIETA